MDEMFNEPIVLLTAIVVLPLIPAVLLYSLFENHSEFRDMKRGIKLGGAVAFYFILFAAAYPMFRTFNSDERNAAHRAELQRLESENADFAREIENTVRVTQATITQMADDYSRKESTLKSVHQQEMTDLRTALNNRIENLTGTFKEEIAEERSKVASLQRRVSTLDLLRQDLVGEWKWDATSSMPAAEASLTATTAHGSLSGAPGAAAPTTRKSTGTATFQRSQETGEILVVGTVDGQPGSFRASEIILDGFRLTYIFEHQPSGTIGVSWLNFVKDGSSVKSMTGYWVLAGREGKGTLSFTRAEKP